MTPHFGYRPRDAVKQRQRDAALARMGIPAGHCRIYDVVIPIEYRDRCRKAATQALKHYGGNKRMAAYWALREWLAAWRGLRHQTQQPSSR